MNDACLKEKFARANTMQAYLVNDEITDFYELAQACIVEVCGQPKPSDFQSVSEMKLWFAKRQNMIREILEENNFENIHPSCTKPQYPKD